MNEMMAIMLDPLHYSELKDPTTRKGNWTMNITMMWPSSNEIDTSQLAIEAQ